MLNGKHLPKQADHLLAFLGICGITGFALMVLRRHWIGYSDFDQIYMAGLAWRHGIVPYVRTTPEFGVVNGLTSQIFGVYFYTPLCGMLASPLSFLSFPLSSFVWKTGVFGLFLWAFWRFMEHVLSAWPVSARLFLLGATALSGSLRWNLMQWQPTALIVALLLLFACAVLDNRWKVAVVLGVVISIKVTYLLPVVGLLLWRGQGKWLSALLGIVLFLNGFALIPTDPAATLTAYRQSLRHMQDVGKQNYPDALDFLTPFLLDAPTSPLAVYTPHNRKAGEWSGEQIHLPFILSAWEAGRALGNMAAMAFDNFDWGRHNPACKTHYGNAPCRRHAVSNPAVLRVHEFIAARCVPSALRRRCPDSTDARIPRPAGT